MSLINPFANSMMGGAPQVQNRLQTEKSQQIRREQELKRNVALDDDRLEYSVESPEELARLHEDDSAHPRKRRKPAAGADDRAESNDEQRGLDIRA